MFLFCWVTDSESARIAESDRRTGGWPSPLGLQTDFEKLEGSSSPSDKEASCIIRDHGR